MLSQPETDVRGAPRANLPAVAVTYRGTGVEPDAILSYSEMLAGALNRTGQVTGSLVTAGPDSRWTAASRTDLASLPLAVGGFDAVLLQYNPFSYGRWGVAPWLLRDLARLRRNGTPVAMMVHEAYLTSMRRRQRPIEAWQRFQIRALLSSVDAAFAATESLRDCLTRINPRIDVHHVPVGSNLPDRRASREETRRRLGLGEQDVALVAFGTGHPSQLASWVERAALSAADGSERQITLLNLGAGAHSLPSVPGKLAVRTPGRLPASELAEWIAAGDVFVAPFSDGVSTRRTTVMAALQHGLPVVTTRASSTDRIFDEASPALSAAPVDALDEFSAHVRRLVENAGARRELGAAGRTFFEQHFSWLVIASRFTDVLTGIMPR